MSRKLEIVLWVLSILIPGVLLGVGVGLIQKQKRPTTTTTAPQPLIEPQLQSPVYEGSDNVGGGGDCSIEPVPCDMANVASCSACNNPGYTCTNVGANDTDYNIEGTFCLPAKPTTACTAPALDPSSRMQGQYRWTGWAGVHVQDWSCSCPYPRLYPMDSTSGSLTEGACKRSSDLCRGGVWDFPCRRDPTDPSVCEELTPEEEAELVGSDPLQYGMCSCDNMPCSTNLECASGVCGDAGVCVGQRVGMNSRTGLPECVRDTCSLTLTCDVATDCPASASAECVDGRCQKQCVYDDECGEGGRCGGGGECVWGVWAVHNVSPYVFGECVLPAPRETCPGPVGGNWQLHRHGAVVPVMSDLSNQTFSFSLDVLRGVPDADGYTWYYSSRDDSEGLPIMNIGLKETVVDSGDVDVSLKYRGRINWSESYESSTYFDTWSGVSSSDGSSYANPEAFVIATIPPDQCFTLDSVDLNAICGVTGCTTKDYNGILGTTGPLILQREELCPWRMEGTGDPASGGALTGECTDCYDVDAISVTLPTGEVLTTAGAIVFDNTDPITGLTGVILNNTPSPINEIGIVQKDVNTITVTIFEAASVTVFDVPGHIFNNAGVYTVCIRGTTLPLNQPLN